jgi:hypothetical protein
MEFFFALAIDAADAMTQLEVQHAVRIAVRIA